VAEGLSAGRLFEPLTINRLRARNRLFVPAHTTNFGDQHRPTERHVEYHRARARGGAAIVIFEAIRVMENTLGRPQGVAGYAPDCVPAYRRVAEAVQAEGALFFAQVCHLGRQIEGEFERTVSWGPSPVRWSLGAYAPREMSTRDMDAVVDGHLRTVENMLEAGADGIELHWGHGHLLQQFLSPLSNRRRDAFGGAIENRMRFPLAVARRLRAAMGRERCLGVRLSAEEFVPEGLHVEEAAEIARRLVAEIAIDFIHVTHSAYHMSESLGTQMADMGVDKAMFRHLPGAIRAAVRGAPEPVAIFTVCKYRDPDDAERIVAAGDADMVGMARAHIADPDIVSKWRSGRRAEVRPCIGCNQGCAQNLEKNLALTCFVNPAAGREGAWPAPESDRAAAPKDVIVVGAGPAGLEAACTAAARGHRVRLWEQSGAIGGRLALASRLRLREDFGLWLEHAAGRLSAAGVRLELGREATVSALADACPDRIVLATGARPVAHRLPDGSVTLTLDAAAQMAAAGKRIAVYDETGDWPVLGLTEHLAEQGAEVTLITPIAGVLWRTTIYSNLTTFARWRAKRIRILPLSRPVSFADGVLTLENTSCGETSTLGVDAIAVCVAPEAHHPLESPLVEAGLAPILVGDCLAARNALEAIFDGHRAARAL
jgi:2,4-dienoyl-CoA reductase-like NADH-dependent reductase (Old Yellow Enzyme family)